MACIERVPMSASAAFPKYVTATGGNSGRYLDRRFVSRHTSVRDFRCPRFAHFRVSHALPLLANTAVLVFPQVGHVLRTRNTCAPYLGRAMAELVVMYQEKDNAHLFQDHFAGRSDL